MPYSLQDLNIINLRNQATPNKTYLGDNGRVYIGTNEGRLRLEDSAVETTFNPTSSISSTNVQEAIESITASTPTNAQNAVGSILTDTSSIDFTYNSITPSITADLTLTGVVAGTYGSATYSPQIIIDNQGRITSATDILISGTGVTSVSGTTNRITTSPTTGAVVVDISASYVGQTSITTVGALTTGSIGVGFTAIGNSSLANSTISGVSLGGTLFGLTPTAGLVMSATYDGSAARTVGIDTTIVATLTGAQALSNKTGLISQWTNDSGYLTSAGTITNADNINITNDNTNGSKVYPTWVTTTTGHLPVYVSSSQLSFVPLTGILAATGFSGPLTGNVTGNVSGTSATFTGNLTGAITSTGMATVLGSFTSANLSSALTDETGTGVAVFGTTPTFTTNITTPLIIGGTGTTSTLTYKTTTGIGAAGADHIFQVGNNGNVEGMRILNSGNVGIFNNGTTPISMLHVGSGALSIINSNSAFRVEPEWTSSAGSFDRAVIVHPYFNYNVGTNAVNIFSNPRIGATFTTPTLYGLYYSPIVDGTITTHYGIYIDAKSGAGTITNNYDAIFNGGGKVGIGTATPTAFLQIKAGTATANTAPIKLTSGTNLTSAEAGVFAEYDGTNFFGTPNTTISRWPFAFNSIQYTTPTTGTTITTTAQVQSLVANPAGTLLALTITFPPSPVNGQIFNIAISQIITTLTLNAGTGSATIDGTIVTSAVNSNGGWVYGSTANTWFKIH